MARRQSRWRLRAALFLGVGLALTGAALVAYGANLFRQLEVDPSARASRSAAPRRRRLS